MKALSSIRFAVALGALALGILAAAPAAAQEAPRFLIEKITVAGNRRPASARPERPIGGSSG